MEISQRCGRFEVIPGDFPLPTGSREGSDGDFPASRSRDPVLDPGGGLREFEGSKRKLSGRIPRRIRPFGIFDAMGNPG